MTYGGIKIDTGTRVLNQEGAPLPGVFATPGAAGGLFLREYGGALAACGVFRRAAGRAAARDALDGDSHGIR